MSTNIGAKLIVGLPYKELISGQDEEFIEQLDEDLDNGCIDYASPYYDSEMDAWIVGYEVTSAGNAADICNEIEKREYEFFMCTNKKPRVIITPNVM